MIDAIGDGLVWPVSIAHEILATGVFDRTIAPLVDDHCKGDTAEPRCDLG